MFMLNLKLVCVFHIIELDFSVIHLTLWMPCTISMASRIRILCNVMSVKDCKWFIVNRSDERERSASQLVIGSVYPITSNL